MDVLTTSINTTNTDTKNDNENDTDRDSHMLEEKGRQSQSQIHSRVDCAIIGAGAAGLQCAANLLGKDVSVVVLEARDRVGGRILTTDESVRTAGIGSDGSPLLEEVLFHRDHGAAWVHGSHNSNPMMQLLAENELELELELESDCHSPSEGATSTPTPTSTPTSTSTSTSTPSQELPPMLDPVFKGNAWIRPHTVLHGTGKRGREKSFISYFVDGAMLPDTVESDDEIDREDCGISSIKTTQPAASRSSRSHFVSRAIRRHYQVLRTIMSKHDNNEYDDCDNVDKLYKQLNSTLPAADVTERREEEERLVSILTPFYLYLMENWNGISMKDTAVDQIVELLVPGHEERNDDGEDSMIDSFAEVVVEEKKDDHIVMPETDVEYVSAGDFTGSHCKVKTGMFTVLKPLIRGIEHHQQDTGEAIICLNEKVVAIIDKTNHVRIKTASGKVIEAKCCVNTMPLGCLQYSISNNTFFQPRLRDEKIEAINSIWSGSYKKVFLTFDHIFWPKDTPIIGLIRSKPDHQSSPTFPGRYLVFYNLWARDNIPSIEATLCGNLGKWAFQKSDDTIRQAVIEFIEASMGIRNLAASCVGCHVTRWEEDEFTRGSYSTFRLGTLDRHVDALGSTEWEGRLIFAGEATDNDHMGSVHAALMSGERAAIEVINSHIAT